MSGCNPLAGSDGTKKDGNFHPGVSASLGSNSASIPVLTISSAGSTQVSLAWTAATGATSYKILYGTSTGNYSLNIQLGDVTSYTVTGLTNTQTYYFKIQASNSAGSTSLSNEVNTIPNVNPNPPTAVVDGYFVTSTTTTPSISWTASTSNGDADFSGYQIAVGTSAGAVDTYGWTSIGNVTSYTLSSGITLANNTTYYVSVRAIRSSGITSSTATGDGFVVNTATATLSCDFSNAYSSSTDCYANAYSTIARPLIKFSRAGGANTSPGTFIDQSGTIRLAASTLFPYSSTFATGWTLINGATKSANATTSPDGSVNATKLIENSDGTHKVIYRSFTATAGAVFTISAYVKSAERSIIMMHARDSATWNERFGAFFDLTNQTITSETNGAVTLQSTKMTPVGSGWYKIQATGSLAAGTTSAVMTLYLANASNGAGLSYTGDGASGAYIYGATVEDNQKYTQNLVLRSEEFDNAAWSKNGTTVTANATTAPDGTSNADFIQEDASNGQHTVVQTFTPAIAKSTYSLSVYVKASTRVHIVTGFWNATDGNVGFTGVDASTCATFSGNGSATSVANGWCRITTYGTINTVALTSAIFKIYFDTATWSWLGDSASGFYLWGAQLEYGSNATNYIYTQATNNYGARIDHDPSSCTSGCARKGLLIEESRSNFITDSAGISAWWAANAGSTVANQAIAPDGTLSGDEVVDDDNLAQEGIRLNGAVAVAADTTVWTYSIFVKQKSGALCSGDFRHQLNLTGGTPVNSAVSINLTSGAMSVLWGTPNSYGATNFGNGWWRVYISLANNSTNTSAAPFAYPSYNTPDTCSVFLWGAQFEAGEIPTSYIPTAGSALTRNADSATINTLSPWYSTTNGSITSSFYTPVLSQTNAWPAIWTFDDGTWNNRFGVFLNDPTNDLFNIYARNGGVTEPSAWSPSALSGNTNYNSCGTYTNSQLKQSVAGSATATSAAISGLFSPTRMNIGSGDYYLNSAVKNIYYFDSTFSSAQTKAQSY